MTRLEGGCHCGRVRFSVLVPESGEPIRVLDCNCSICRKKGFLHLIVPKSAFTLLAGEDCLTTYTFNTHTAKHTFCRVCGIYSFYTPRSHPDGIDVNVRCLDELDSASRFVTEAFDGVEWEANVEAIR